MEVQALIGFLSLTVAIGTVAVKTWTDKGKQMQQLSEMERRLRDMETSRQKEDEALILRVAALEKQQAVTEATCQSLKENLDRIEAGQKAQTEKIDKILETVYQLTVGIVHEK